MSYTIDLTPLLDALLPAIGVVLSVLLSYGIGIAAKKFKIEIEAKHREALQSALQNAIGFGLKKAGDAGRDLAKIDTRNEVLAAGVNYVVASVPGALTKLNVDNTRLRQLLEAKLGLAVNTPVLADASALAPQPGTINKAG